MTPNEAKQLLDKYLSGNATPEECQIVESWYDQFSKEKPLSDNDDFEHLSEELWQKTVIAAKLRAKERKISRFWPAVAVAASVTIFLLAGIRYFSTQKQSPENRIAQHSHPIVPGSNKAILTLASGKQLLLTDEKNGQIAKEHNVTINKTTAGQINYTAGGSDKQQELNTLITPRGGQYTVVLADGTKVTLNAASSLIYPVKFNGNDREVELKGEGYFEVAHDPSKPFRVKSNGQTIEVLGTHFNINSYSNEPYVKTTLLQGNVKLIANKHEVILKPGQQSRLDVKGDGSVLMSEVNTDEAVAWKNGLFEFKESSIGEVMRQAERWYDVDVNYSGKEPDIKISGSMSRNVNFSGFIKLLEFEGVKFNIKDHRVSIVN